MDGSSSMITPPKKAQGGSKELDKIKNFLSQSPHELLSSSHNFSKVSHVRLPERKESTRFSLLNVDRSSATQSDHDSSPHSPAGSAPSELDQLLHGLTRAQLHSRELKARLDKEPWNRLQALAKIAGAARGGTRAALTRRMINQIRKSFPLGAKPPDAPPAEQLAQATDAEAAPASKRPPHPAPTKRAKVMPKQPWPLYADFHIPETLPLFRQMGTSEPLAPDLFTGLAGGGPDSQLVAVQSRFHRGASVGVFRPMLTSFYKLYAGAIHLIRESGATSLWALDEDALPTLELAAPAFNWAIILSIIDLAPHCAKASLLCSSQRVAQQLGVPGWTGLELEFANGLCAVVPVLPALLCDLPDHIIPREVVTRALGCPFPVGAWCVVPFAAPSADHVSLENVVVIGPPAPNGMLPVVFTARKPLNVLKGAATLRGHRRRLCGAVCDEDSFVATTSDGMLVAPWEAHRVAGFEELWVLEPRAAQRNSLEVEGYDMSKVGRYIHELVDRAARWYADGGDPAPFRLAAALRCHPGMAILREPLLTARDNPDSLDTQLCLRHLLSKRHVSATPPTQLRTQVLGFLGDVRRRCAATTLEVTAAACLIWYIEAAQ
eukprot:gnl/Chilomastix_cuspidata/2404.p1 GENE.gnl/Chilomastix_cuspidata/2404~~gnl/Chilomastix_cuspidata/2404.p1  ORF type:complete len:606 (-),score=238.80 gnl/Chilomastix_cuspidata/2404:661-2478(-)